MKFSTILLSSLLFLSCSDGVGFLRLSSTELAAEVRSSMESTWKGTEMESTIVDFTLTHESGNKYKGLLNTNELGYAFVYVVNVTYDGDNLIWEIVE